MKKIIRVLLIIICLLFIIILIDTLQARIFKNSSIISIKEELSDGDSWIDKGILMDTYYCVKEKDIITVSWHFKGSKFNCPIDNVDDNIYEINGIDGVSMEIKEGTLTKDGATIIITDNSGKNYTYGDEYRIDKYENNKWKEATIVVKGNYGFNSIGYHIDKNNKLELDINWKWLYGSLDKGKYRIVKSVALSKDKYFSCEFIIE